MGGNVFDFTSPIPKEFIEPTLDEYKNSLSEYFPELPFELIGSAGKKPISSDIDLGLPTSVFIDYDGDSNTRNFGIDYYYWRHVYLKLKERARTSTDEQLKIKSFLRCFGEQITDFIPDIKMCPIQKIGIGSVFTAFPQYDVEGQRTDKWVQIDWIVGPNMDWIRYANYSAEYKNQNIKGLHRTQLLIALLANRGLVLNHTQGVKEKFSGEVLARTPKELVALLNVLYQHQLPTDTRITMEDTMDYYKLFNIILEPSRCDTNGNRQLFDDVIKIYLKILDITKCDIPKNLTDVWLINQEKWELTGKYLPEGSVMKQILKDRL